MCVRAFVWGGSRGSKRLTGDKRAGSHGGVVVVGGGRKEAVGGGGRTRIHPHPLGFHPQPPWSAVSTDAGVVVWCGVVVGCGVVWCGGVVVWWCGGVV